MHALGAYPGSWASGEQHVRMTEIREGPSQTQPTTGGGGGRITVVPDSDFTNEQKRWERTGRDGGKWKENTIKTNKRETKCRN